MSVRGTGHAPAGYRTWVAFRSEDNNQYYIANVIVDAVNADEWRSAKSIVGDAASVRRKFFFYAFNAPLADTAELTKLTYGTPVAALPRHRSGVATMVTTRDNSDTAACVY
ncbi:hypothetical protein ACWERV_13155 [Streptomyces sp. NPDC004031]